MWYVADILCGFHYGVGLTRRGIVGLEGHFFTAFIVITVDGHDYDVRVVVGIILRVCYAATLAVYECSHDVVAVLTRDVENIQCTNQIHRAFEVACIYCPFGFLTAYGNRDGQRHVDAIGAGQVDGLLILADGRRLSNGEGHLRLGQRIGGAALGASLQPCRHAAQRPHLHRAALVHHASGDCGCGACLQICGQRVVLPEKRVAVDEGAPDGRLGVVAILVAYGVHAEVQGAAFDGGGIFIDMDNDLRVGGDIREADIRLRGLGAQGGSLVGVAER